MLLAWLKKLAKKIELQSIHHQYRASFFLKRAWQHWLTCWKIYLRHFDG
jgi:hypothetical protein